MARTPKPWYYAARDQWVIWRDGKKVPLAQGKTAKKEATRAFHALMAEERKVAAAGSGMSLRALKDIFLDDAERKLKPLTYEFYKRHCLGFWRHVGTIAAAEVRPYHVTAWLAGTTWNATTQHGAVTAVKRMYRWAKKEGHIEANPLAEVEKPAPLRREEILSDAQVNEILDATRDQAFKDLLTMARETGCRPSELLAIESRHVDLADGVIALDSKTGARVIHLTPGALALCRELAERWPDGPLLRNRDGNPWNRNATKSRFARLRDKLGMGREATLESFRHGFATDALEAGVPIKTLAELMGHSSTAMIDRHYSKLHKRRKHLKEAVVKVRPGEGAGLTRDGTASRPGERPEESESEAA